MKLVKKYPMLGSSHNPEEVSMTIKSVGVWLVPMIIAIASAFGVAVEESLLVQMVNTVAVLVATGMTLYGLARKAYYIIIEK